MDGMIKISKKDWHYKLIKYTFNVDGTSFSNLCPYFWLFIASLFACPFVFLHRLLIEPFYNYSIIKSKELSNDVYYSTLKRVNINDMLLLYNTILGTTYWFTDVNFSKIIPQKVINKAKNKGVEAVYNDWCRENNIDDSTINQSEYNSHKKIEEKLSNLNLFKGEYSNLNKNAKEKALLISSRTKKIFTFILNTILFVIICILGFCSSALLTFFFSQIVFISLQTPNISSAILSILFFGIIVTIFKSYIYANIVNISNSILYKDSSKNISKFEYIIFLIPSLIYIILYILLYKFLYLMIFKPFFNGLWIVITESFDIFGQYLKSAYSDYCPGIEWDKDDKK